MIKRLAALAVLLLPTSSALAWDNWQHQIHGFASQGAAWSNGNNAYGNSTDGSLKYYELGVNGRLQTHEWFSVSAQAVARRAGASDDGQPRIDFAFMDLQPIHSPDWQAGVRLGRVKNPHGFHNETRDVIFSRPGIALPNSIYSDGQGYRGFMFSVDGAQIYGQRSQLDQFSSLTINLAPDYEVTEQDDRALLGRFSAFSDRGDFRMRDFLRTQARHEWGEGRWSAAASYFSGLLDFATTGGTVRAQQDIELGVLSVAYRSTQWILTAEYQRTWTDIDYQTTNTTFATKTVGDGGYLQLDRRFSPRWAAFARIDSRFNNAKDRDGRGSNDRYRQFAHDIAIGGHWQPDPHWGVWGEVHHIYGTASVPTQDNTNRSLDPHWTLLLLMAAYRF